MSVIKAGTSQATARLIVDDEYYGVARALISQARRTCLASVFIVDLKSGQLDRDARVFQLLKLLRTASWRGVQVRLLVGGSRSNLVIAETAEIARYVSRELGIPCRWLTSQDVRGSHTKMVISDNRVLVGSHNWSAPAFTDQTQDSILLESAALAAYLTAYFNTQWQRAEWRA